MSDNQRNAMSEQHAAMGRIQVFYSYAHVDRHHLDGLMSSLQDLKAKSIIDGWSDGMLRPGQRWDDRIKGALNNSHLVLFLVTENLLKSEYINTQEMRIALEREAKQQCQILPVLLDKPDPIELWYQCPLSKFQPAPAIDNWVSDSGGFTSANQHMIGLGVLDACKAVGGGDNPLRRCKQGDWRRMQGFARYPTGQVVEWEYTEELIERTQHEAVVRERSTYSGGITEKVLTYSLTEPLDDQNANIATQAGIDWSAMEAMSMRTSADGPEMREELVTINMRQYETRVRSRVVHGKFREIAVTSKETMWQSLDAPFDGTVEAEQEFDFTNGPNNFASRRLLAHGNVNDDQPVPEPRVLQPLQAAPPMQTQPWQAPAMPSPPDAHVARDAVGGFFNSVKTWFGSLMDPAVSAGRWWLETHDSMGHASFDLDLQPSGMFQGVSVQNQVQYQLSGMWRFDSANRVLTLSGSGAASGYPPMPLNLAFQIDPSNDSVCYASDPPGRPLQITRM